MKFSRIAALGVVVLAALVTIVGKGGGGAPAAPPADTTAPTAQIKFPALVGLTNGDSVLITGTASDASMITRVKVAGVDATTTDDFANWRAVVPLINGDNTLLVETTDEFSNVDSAAATVAVEASDIIWTNPEAVALDSANGRALVTENDSSAGQSFVIAVDLASGLRTILSDNIAGMNGGDTFPFTRLTGITLDTTTTPVRALVTDYDSSTGQGAVIAVDLMTGARTILSDNSADPMTGSTENPFSNPISIALDTANDRALVLDNFFGPVLAVDLMTGVRTILSDNADGMNGGDTNPFQQTFGIAVDGLNGRALVTDGGLGPSAPGALVAVDLTTGDRTILSGAASPGPAFSIPFGIAMDNGRALVTENKANALVAVALADGARTMLSETSTPDAVNPFGAPGAIAVDGDNSRALVIDFGSSAVLAVAHADGARTILSDATTPDAVKPFNSLIDIAVDSANGRALVTDAVGFNPGEGAVVAVDLMTGARTILSDAMTPDAVNPITAGPIAVDSANGRALVTNIISPPPSVPPDPSQGVVIAVDLMTGARTILSDSSAGMNGGDANPLVFPIAIAVDSANDRALVLDENLQAVVTVDLMTGARTILSDATTPDTVNPFTRVFNIVVDSANNRALVLDSNLPGVVAVDLASGARTIVSDASGPGAVNSFQMPVGIALDSVNERALVTDLAGFNAVIAVELTSGDRVIVSK
jgi:hypothetical protein